MDAQQIVNALEQLLDLGDTLDNMGGGVQALTDGEHTTRELCRMELAQFLIYVANGNYDITDSQTAVINVVLGPGSSLSSFQLQRIAITSDTPDPSQSVSLKVFLASDMTIAQQRGNTGTSLTDILTSVYEAFGQLIILFDDNNTSRDRFSKYIEGMKSLVARSVSSGTRNAGHSVSTTASSNNSSNKAQAKPSSKKSSPTAKKNSAANTVGSKNTSTKKASPVTSKTVKSLWDQYEAEKDAQFITIDDIKAALDKEKFDGIHEVINHSEWITPNGIWAMRIPAGFSYTLDSEKTLTVGPMHYDAQIQMTGGVDFSIEKHTPFSMVVAPMIGLLRSDDGCADLLSDEASDAIESFKSSIRGDWSTIRLSSDVVVLFQAWAETIERKQAQRILFAVIVSGCTIVTGGEMTMAQSLGDPILSFANDFLKNIVKVPRRPISDSFEPSLLPHELRLTYEDQNKLKLSDGRLIPIPDGYKGSTDEKKTARAFSIISKEKEFWNGQGDNTYLPLDLSMMKMNSNKLPTSNNISGKVALTVAKQTPEGVLEEGVPFFLARQTESSSIFYQIFTDLDDMSYACVRALEIEEDGLHIYTIRMNFNEEIPKRYYQLMRYEASMLACSWLLGFPKDAEERYNQGMFYVKPIEELDEEYHEHFYLVESGRYTTHRDADFRAQPIRELMANEGNKNTTAFELMEIKGDSYSLYDNAAKLATIFRVDDSLFDPVRDTEAMIHLGMFRNIRSYHALRSLAWTVAALSRKANREIGDFSFDELLEVGEAIKQAGWLNYATDSYFQSLCEEYDWHVFYVPNQFIDSDECDDEDLRVLCGKENRGGNTVSIVVPGLGINSFDESNHINELISRNEETVASLEDLRAELVSLLPVMETIFDGLAADRKRGKTLEGPLAEALNAWCALAVAAKEPFYTEEAADTPEANAALHGPLQKPEEPIYEGGNGTKYAKGSIKSKNNTSTEHAAKSKPAQVQKEKNTRANNEDYLSHDEIIFKDKTFVFYGITVQYTDPLAGRLEMAGGQLRMDVTSKTDYLVVKTMEGKEGAKLKKAKDYIDKGQELRIVCFEDFETALSSAGFTEAAFESKKKKEEADRKRKIEEEEREAKKDKYLDLGGSSVIKSNQFSYRKLESLGKVIIPEGVTSIEQSAFSHALMSEIVFPASLRRIGILAFDECSNLNQVEFKEGIEEIGSNAFHKCLKLQDVHLPDSLKVLDRYAFISDNGDINNYRSGTTLHMSGKLAEYLNAHNPYPMLSEVIAHAFFIDGRRYDTIKEYIEMRREEEKQRLEAEERERRERVRREREAAERQAAEDRKKAERDRISAEIFDLSQEMDSLKGLFSGMKRKKLQKRIDELNEQLRRV